MIGLTDHKSTLDSLVRRFLSSYKGLSVPEGHGVIEDYIYTEAQESGWVNSERDSGHNFAKRIATPLPTKQRRRVTLRNNIYM
jgi:hypothetical protein